MLTVLFRQDPVRLVAALQVELAPRHLLSAHTDIRTFIPIVASTTILATRISCATHSQEIAPLAVAQLTATVPPITANVLINIVIIIPTHLNTNSLAVPTQLLRLSILELLREVLSVVLSALLSLLSLSYGGKEDKPLWQFKPYR